MTDIESENLTSTQVTPPQLEPKINKKLILGLFAIIIFISTSSIVGYLILKEINTTQNVTQQSAAAAEPEKLPTISSPSSSPQLSTKNPFNPTDSSTQPPQPTTSQKSYLGTQTTRIYNSQGQDIGSVSRKIETTQLTRTLSVNLPDPPPNQFYQVWIQNFEGSQINIGQLTKNPSSLYTLTSLFYYSQPVASGIDDQFNRFTITQETILDDQPETTIATGFFPLQ